MLERSSKEKKERSIWGFIQLFNHQAVLQHWRFTSWPVVLHHEKFQHDVPTSDCDNIGSALPDSSKHQRQATPSMEDPISNRIPNCIVVSPLGEIALQI
jgi:hypothetical protein